MNNRNHSQLIDKVLDEHRRAVKMTLVKLIEQYGVDMVAEMAHVTVHMMRKFSNVNEDRHIDAANYRVLNRNLSSVSDHRVVKMFVPDNCSLAFDLMNFSPNGSLSEELKALYKAANALIDGFDEGAPELFAQGVEKLQETARQFEAEGKKRFR